MKHVASPADQSKGVVNASEVGLSDPTKQTMFTHVSLQVYNDEHLDMIDGKLTAKNKRMKTTRNETPVPIIFDFSILSVGKVAEGLVGTK